MNEKIPDTNKISLLGIGMFTFLMISLTASLGGASELVILYSNDIRGEIEPCG